MGRAAAGVRGAELEDDDDEVVGMVAVSRPDAEILVVTERGFGKRTPIGDYRLTSRGAQGVLTLKTTERNGRIAAIKEVVNDDELMIITRKGVLIRVPVSGVSQLGRATQGVHLIRLEEGDEVAAVAHIVRDDELEEVAGAEGVALDAVDDAVDDAADEATEDSAEDADTAADEAADEGPGRPPRRSGCPAQTIAELGLRGSSGRGARIACDGIHKQPSATLDARTGQGGLPLQRARGGNGPDSERRKPGLYMDRASSSTVARLSSYFRVLGEFDREHVETISSKRLAERCGITSAQVRKDLSVFGNFGRRGLGYNVSELQAEIGAILGWDAAGGWR
jgi:hypothetical protein